MNDDSLLKIVRKNVVQSLYRRVFENVCGTTYSKNCLLIYVATAYLRIPVLSRFIKVPSHQNIWQTQEIALAMSQLGYNVDVVDYSVEGIRLRKTYDVVIDIHPRQKPMYMGHLRPNAKKIAFITGPNPAFSNAQETKRLANLSKRRGVTIQPRRHIVPFPDSLATYDALLFVGNSYNLRQYDEFKIKKKYCIPNYGYASLRPTTTQKKDSHSFLFLGSSGMVFRGLDLLLEAFSKMPQYHLYICASLEEEPDFVHIYENELRTYPNIHIEGFVSLGSQKYRDLCSRCSYMILPSCAEGMSGSVLVAMSAGVIPLVMRECGVDGLHYFTDPSVDSLSRVVRTYAEKPMLWIRSESKRVVNLVEKKYTKEQFSSLLRHALRDALSV